MRLAFLTKGGGAFADVLGLAEVAERAGLELQSLVERHRGGANHDILREPLRERRPRREHRRILHCFIVQTFGRDDAVDQTDPQRMIRSGPLAGKDDLHGVAIPLDNSHRFQVALIFCKHDTRIYPAVKY
jgi:hypothetical protein